MIEYENLAKSNSPFFEEFLYFVKKFLKSGEYVLGKNVSNFEKEFANYIGTDFCVGVGSGLDALRISLRSLELEKGSEIIVPSNTYIATILPIVDEGFTPILVEPDIETYNIDAKKIEEKITKKTKCIMITHLYGKACEMDTIMDLVKKYDLKLIEDCAQAHGAKYKNKKVGSFGTLGAFSFYPTKNLGAMGEAGAITTNNPHLAKKIKMLRNYGSEKKYYNEMIGFNSRLDEIQATLLLIKLKSLDKINEHKRKLAKIYDEKIIHKEIIKPILKKDFYDVFHIYNIRHSKRDELKKYLEEQGISTNIHYPVPPHKQKAMENKIFGSYPVSEEIHNTTLSLPISYFHTEEDILKISETINKFKSSQKQ